MTDEEFSAELVRRLNALLVNDDVRKDVARLFQTYCYVSKSTRDHPTIQVLLSPKDSSFARLSALGFINGITGMIKEGHGSGHGYVTAIFSSTLQEVKRFELTNTR